MSVRKRYTADFKARVALEALKGIRTCNEIASDHGIHPVQVSQWKKDAADGLATVFSGSSAKKDAEKEALAERLYQQIGELKVELDFLKKKSGRAR
jgi:putative transposase